VVTSNTVIEFHNTKEIVSMIRNIVLGAAAALFAVNAAFAQPPFPAASGTATNTTTTYTPQPLPPFGLGSTETARVDVMNVATASSTGTAASCTGSIAFFNASGTQIGTATTYTLSTNQISSASLPFGSAGLTSPRGEITVLITPTVPSTSAPPCQLRATLATFDTTTGATHLYVPAGGGPGGFGGPGHP
jgi:hypothetical protein